MEKLRAANVLTLPEFIDWARALQLRGPYPANTIRRYAIGIYQLYQAYDWSGTTEEHESNAAASIHILAAAESLDIPLEQFLRIHLLVDIPYRKRDDGMLLYHISKLQGQLVYGTNSPGIRRKSRFNRNIAGPSLAYIIEELLGRVPVHERTYYLYSAMETMTGEL
jgi:hypothetical protein